MNSNERMTWFKQNFGAKIAAATAGTPITVDLVTAIANQETGYLWSTLLAHHNGDVDEVLRDCVGDTLDYPKRNARAFPRNKADLLTEPYGQDLFEIAREALGRIGAAIPAYGRVHDRYPDKFCHGFGILQYDIQHVKTDPDFFLDRQWADFDICLSRCLKELDFGLRKRGFQDATHLSDFELATVAIVYNTGGYNSARGLRQGHKSDGKYYGERIKEYLEIAHRIDLDDTNSWDDDEITDVVPETYVVTARSGLNLRGGPGTDYGINDTIEPGKEVNVVTFMGPDELWALVDLDGDGGRDGFMYAEFLAPVSQGIADPDTVEEMLRLEMSAVEDDPISWANDEAGEYPD